MIKDVVAELLGALTTRDPTATPEAILKFTEKDDSDPAYLRHVAGLVFQGWNRMHDHPGGIDGEMLMDLARRGGAMDEASFHVRTALDYLAVWSEANRYYLENQLRRATYSDLSGDDDRIAGLRGAIDSCNSRLRTAYGPLMLEGMAASLRDRSAAADLFRDAQAENPEFAAAQRLDQFVATYFTREAVERGASEIAERRATLLDSFQSLVEPARKREDETMILFSCDPAFFAAFFPYWVSNVEYLRNDDVSLHFVLVGERGEAEAAVDRGLALASAISRLRGVDPAGLSSCLSFSTVAVPDYVEVPRTLYACVRYLLAHELARQFDRRLLILDIDMVLRGDPADLLRSLGDLSGTRLPVVMTKGPKGLIPARRYLAGRFFLADGELGHEAMRHVEEYMYLGLSSPISWTLDQNALTYAVEQIVAAHGPASTVDIEGFGRPFAQVPIRHLMRAVQQRRGAAPLL